MEYTIEDITPVKKHISISVPAEEANAAIYAAIAMYRRDTDIKGFRKGKVPTSLIESRFKKQIYSEATTDLINTHINQIFQETELSPVSRLDVDAGELEKDTPFAYTVSFEVVPAFELPSYTGLKAEQERVEIKDEDVGKVLDRLRDNLAELVVIEEDRPATEGDTVVIGFAAFEGDKPLPGIAADNFELVLGQGHALESFEAIVKGMKTGESAEGEVTFPEDFLNKDLAGKSVTMKITLHAIKEKKLPELDEEFARKAGNYSSVDALKETIANSYRENRAEIVKSAAQQRLLEQLSAGTDFMLPESMVHNQLERMIEEQKHRLERRGKSLDSAGKTEEQLAEEYRSEAESIIRSQLVLLAIARQEGLSVSEKEVDAAIQQMSMRTGRDYNTLRRFHEENNLMFALRDKLLADKAMEYVYHNADITQIDAKDLTSRPEAGPQETDTEDEQQT